MKGEESLYLSRLIQNYSNKDSVVLVGDTRDQWNRRENPEVEPNTNISIPLMEFHIFPLIWKNL